ncbi:hypothetical protein OSTOST_05385 [Ostertagia ostertagi]
MGKFHLQFFVVLSIVNLSLVSAQDPAQSNTTESTTESTIESTTESASVSSTAGSRETTGVTTASTTASTTEASTTTIPYEAENLICPRNRGMKDTLRIRASMAHNYRRSRLAMGLVRNKRGRTLPTASNMRNLEYNCTSEEWTMKAAAKVLCNSTFDNAFFCPRKQRSDFEVFSRN